LPDHRRPEQGQCLRGLRCLRVIADISHGRQTHQPSQPKGRLLQASILIPPASAFAAPQRSEGDKVNPGTDKHRPLRAGIPQNGIGLGHCRPNDRILAGQRAIRE
jgi:hypothetical protein